MERGHNLFPRQRYDKMSAIRTTRRLVSAYTDKESLRSDLDEASSTIELEEKIAWGVLIFQGLLDLEARAQSRAIQNPSLEDELLFEVMPIFYQLWMDSSEFYLERVRDSLTKGHLIHGVEAFEQTLEEARALLGNLEIEDEIRPIEELAGLAKPENPSRERYGD